MSRGVYIVANDRVFDPAVALLSSLRSWDPDIRVVMIPFDQAYEHIWPVLNQSFNVELFPDLTFVETLTRDIADIFPRDFLKLPNKMRKLAAWFGPLDEFIYVDTDVLLFQSIENSLNYLQQADFVACDFHYKGRGLSEIFTPVVKDQQIFTEAQLRNVFNSGFWGSRQRMFSYKTMVELLRDCAAHRDYFDFSTGTTDQPILNYLVLRAIDRRLNITQMNAKEPGSWAGSSHFEQIGDRLYDGGRPLRYLHWAGTPLRPGGPYWDIWEQYRFRDVADPLCTVQSLQQEGMLTRIRKRLAL